MRTKQIRIEIIPDEFDIKNWGEQLIFSISCNFDYCTSVIYVMEEEATKKMNSKMHTFAVIMKSVFWIPMNDVLTFIDKSLAEDEFYILLQNINGTKKMFYHSYGA